VRALFKRAGLDPSALAEAVERMRQGRKADAPSRAELGALTKYARDLTEEAGRASSTRHCRDDESAARSGAGAAPKKIRC